MSFLRVALTLYIQRNKKWQIEQLQELRSIANQLREEKKKTLVSLRINDETLEKTRSLGKGYTDILSRLLDLAIDDP